MFTRRMGMVVTSAATAAGAYALYESRKPPYEPRMTDYANAGYAVATGVVAPQPPPVRWVCPNREMLEASNPRPEVSGVNRALNEYGVSLREQELAYFLVQGKSEYNPFQPGPDLAAERLISRSFGDEHAELMRSAASRPDLSPEVTEQVRKQAAAAKVGEVAHALYGSVKSTFSYGAVNEEDLGVGSYNEAEIDKHIGAVDAQARAQRELLAERPVVASIAATRSMKQALHGIKDDAPQPSPPEDTPSSPTLR